jgi:hypothetical protein
MILGVTLGTFLVIFLVAIFLATFFMWLGAKMAGAKNSTFGNSFFAAIGAAFITWLISWFGSLIHLNASLSYIIGLILAIFVIKGIFEITFGRALLVWLFNIVAQVLAIVIGFLIFGTAVLTLVR